MNGPSETHRPAPDLAALGADFVYVKPVLVADLPDALPAVIGDAAIALVDHTALPLAVARACANLAHVVFLGTGARSYMDPEALAAHGVAVHTIRGYGDTAVAECAIALMFAAARGIAAMDRAMRAGAWQRTEGLQLTGRRLGLVGFGGIAREVAALFDLELATPPGTDPSPDANETLDITIDDFEACPRYIGRLFRNATIGPLRSGFISGGTGRPSMPGICPTMRVMPAGASALAVIEYFPSAFPFTCSTAMTNVRPMRPAFAAP